MIGDHVFFSNSDYTLNYWFCFLIWWGLENLVIYYEMTKFASVSILLKKHLASTRTRALLSVVQIHLEITKVHFADRSTWQDIIQATNSSTHLLPQSTPLKDGYLASYKAVLGLAHYMLPAALEYPSGDWNGLRVYWPAREERSCEHLSGYKIINRIPLTFTFTTGLPQRLSGLKRKDDGFLHVRHFQKLRSYRDEIETWSRCEIIPFLRKYLRGMFQLQKDHRQPSTTPHIWGSSGDSNLRAYAWEPVKWPGILCFYYLLSNKNASYLWFESSCIRHIKKCLSVQFSQRKEKSFK